MGCPAILLALGLLGGSVVEGARAVAGAAKPSLLLVLSLVFPAAPLVLLLAVVLGAHPGQGLVVVVVLLPAVLLPPLLRFPPLAFGLDASCFLAPTSCLTLSMCLASLSSRSFSLPYSFSLFLSSSPLAFSLDASCLLAATSCLTLSMCSAARPWCPLLA